MVKPGGVYLDDGGQHRASKGQRWLWKNWLDFWAKVGSAARARDAQVIGIFNGDLVDVNGKHQQSQNISQNRSDVLEMAVDVLEPALDVVDTHFVVRGTAAHVGSSGEMEDIIAIDTGAEGPGKGQHSWWELILEIDGVKFDIRHHGPLGRLDHTAGNALNRRATEIMSLYWTDGQRIPDIAVQSHNHRFATSSDSYPVKVFAMPAWQLSTEFVKRISIIKPADIGGIWFDLDKGSWQQQVELYPIKLSRPWRQKRSSKNG